MWSQWELRLLGSSSAFNARSEKTGSAHSGPLFQAWHCNWGRGRGRNHVTWSRARDLQLAPPPLFIPMPPAGITQVSFKSRDEPGTVRSPGITRCPHRPTCFFPHVAEAPGTFLWETPPRPPHAASFSLTNPITNFVPARGFDLLPSACFSLYRTPAVSPERKPSVSGS